MATSTFVDIFTVNSADAVNTTYARTGYGFTPKGFLCFVVGRSETTDTVGSADFRGSIGLASSTSRRCCNAASIFDALATSNTNSCLREDAVVATISTANVIDGLLDISSFDSDGLTFIVDDQFPISFRVLVVAFGGTDITNSEVVLDTTNSATGNETINNVDNFTPTITFMTVGRSGTVNAVTSHASGCNLGVAMSSTKRWSIALGDTDNQMTMQASRYMTDLECIARFGTGAVSNFRADFVSNNSAPGGVTVNWLENTAANRAAYLMIGGGSWDIGTLSTRTDATQINVTGLAFQPGAVLFMSHCAVESTQDTAQTNAILSVGAGMSASIRYALGMSSENALADSEVNTIIEHDEVYAKSNLADGIDALMDLVSMNSDGFSCVMDDTEPTVGSFVGWVAIGGGGPVNPLLGFLSFVAGAQDLQLDVSLMLSTGGLSLLAAAIAADLIVTSEPGSGALSLLGYAQTTEITSALDLTNGVVSWAPVFQVSEADILSDPQVGQIQWQGQTESTDIVFGAEPASGSLVFSGNLQEATTGGQIDLDLITSALTLVGAIQGTDLEIALFLLEGALTLTSQVPSLQLVSDLMFLNGAVNLSFSSESFATEIVVDLILIAGICDIIAGMPDAQPETGVANAVRRALLGVGI